MRLDVGCTLAEARELNPELIQTCSEWMDLTGQESAVNSEPFDDPFDLAVACAYDLKVSNEKDGWDIPVYIMELDNEKMP